MHSADHVDVFQSSPVPPGYRTQSEDTSYWADQVMFAHLRTLDPQATVAMIGSACAMMDDLLHIGLRREHPQAGEEELRLRAAVLEYGAELMQKLTGLTLPRP
jgi:hypothetical protein